MDRVVQFVGDSLSSFWFSDQASAPRAEDDAEHTVSYADICVARAMLRTLGLPTELVLEILAYAQYEPVIEFASSRRVTADASMGAATSAYVCLPAEVLSHNTIREISGPNVSLKVKEIKFDFESKDQGWTSEVSISIVD